MMDESLDENQPPNEIYCDKNMEVDDGSEDGEDSGRKDVYTSHCCE